MSFFEGTGLLVDLSHVDKLAVFAVLVTFKSTKLDQGGEASPTKGEGIGYRN